ncbi:MAG: methyltransferase domain-containing protein [Ferruginibacter sp.]|nr:methyltransferase domain-containing protein [Rhodoferax sp.]
MNQAPTPNPAEMYQQYFVPAMFLPWANILLNRAAPQPRERVLDVACGTGVVARAVSPLLVPGGQVVALDSNDAMLAVARAQPAPEGDSIQWQNGDAMALPFTEGAFHLVLCQHGLQFFPDRAGAVREMARVLQPGGRAAVIVLQSLDRHPVFDALMRSVAQHLGRPVTEVTTPFCLGDAEALRGLFVAAGFGTVELFTDTITASFAEPERFVPLAVASSAAAVPAFQELAAPERAALLKAVATDVDAALQPYRTADAIRFPMFAHVVVATKKV